MNPAQKPCCMCGAAEFYSTEVDARAGTIMNLLPIGGLLLSAPRLIVQVCGSCGHVEWFVPPRLLDKVKAKFKRSSS